jgi:hypothetical protein
MMRTRRGMALAVTIGIVSLVAILAVATLSLAGRLAQTSTMGLRDARLDAGAAFGLAAATDQWRSLRLGRLAVGATMSFDASPPGVGISVGVSVTRVGDQIFWVAAEATSIGGAIRRESVILRARAPDASSLVADDSSNVTTLGFVLVDSLAMTADIRLPSGSIVAATDGLVHIAGEATLTGGSGTGVLIVEGRLTITGPLSYEGVIVARAGISIVVPGVTVIGVVRAAGTPGIAGNLTLVPSGEAAQHVLLQVLTPRPVAGRRWTELH